MPTVPARDDLIPALRAARLDRRAVPALCRRLLARPLIVLGGVEDDGGRTGQAQLDVLHYMDAEEHVMPLFTSEDHVKAAVENDPNCAKLQAITVEGGYLLEAVAPNVVILVNPWTDLEVELRVDDLRRAKRSAPPPG